MGYLVYEKSARGEGRCHFRKVKTAALAGNRSGIIVKYLRTQIGPEDDEPYTWHLPMDDALTELEYPGNAFVIDLKPNNLKILTMFEIRDIWGYSSYGWTPVLFRLRTLLQDVDRKEYEASEFEVPDYRNTDMVNTFLYVTGSVQDGKIAGTWNFPGASPTNSVLLWPRHQKYFIPKMEASRDT